MRNKSKIAHSGFYKFIREFKNSVEHFIRRIFSVSDYNRWKEEENLAKNWEPRTALMADYIEPNSKVLEFGAGRMFLKKYLPEGCIYTPSDIVDRGENTFVWDLNSKELPKFEKKYDTIIFSGVLEYIFDVERIIKHLQPLTQSIIVSYATIEMNPENRKSHGWVNNFREEQFVSIFTKNGFNLVHSNNWKTQRIFQFKKDNL